MHSTTWALARSPESRGASFGFARSRAAGPEWAAWATLFASSTARLSRATGRCPSPPLSTFQTARRPQADAISSPKPHPTSGVMPPPCAPSLTPDVGSMMWNLPNMISQGYIVVATDYPGLGTEGIHPYLI